MKKFIAFSTMATFIVFSLSCYSTKNIRFDTDAAQKIQKKNIPRVVMISGVTIEFSKGWPGYIQNGMIKGEAVRITGEINKAYIVRQGNKKHKTVVSIPLSEVKQVGIRKINVYKTILFSIGAIVAFSFLMAAAGGLNFTQWR